MIIVSQDKTMIFNFNNIETIGIGNPLENCDGKFSILAETTSDNQYPIAEYKTEERTKVVIQEKIKEYRLTEITKATINRVSDDVGALAIKNVFVYEMPED